MRPASYRQISERLDRIERQRAARRRPRHDGVAFARACGLEPDPWQARLLESDARQVLLNCSRQAGKSTTTALLALHEALYVPNSLTLLLAPALRQSQELFMKVRGHAAALGLPVETFERETALQMTIAGGGRIVTLPGSNDANIRGFSAVSLLVIDEAARLRDDVYHSVRPMLAVSGGRLIALSSPYGRRGFFYSEWSAGGTSWQRFEVPAVEVPRISAEFLEQERRSLGPLWFSQEYEATFIDAEGAVFTAAEIEAAITPRVKALEGW